MDAQWTHHSHSAGLQLLCSLLPSCTSLTWGGLVPRRSRRTLWSGVRDYAEPLSFVNSASHLYQGDKLGFLCFSSGPHAYNAFSAEEPIASEPGLPVCGHVTGKGPTTFTLWRFFLELTVIQYSFFCVCVREGVGWGWGVGGSVWHVHCAWLYKSRKRVEAFS